MRTKTGYIYLQDFETWYSSSDLRQWCTDRNNWTTWGTVSFLMMLFVLPKIMRSHKPFDLRGILFFWNMGLALFSLFASARLWQFMRADLASFSADDYRRTICELGTDNVTSLWMYLYCMSKFVQFGDTFFLIVRKKPLTFLHQWHHSVVLAFMWTQFTTGSPALKYFMLMNVIIHAVMYFYYALQCLNIRIHKSVAMTITAVQILQMVAGLWTQYLTYHYLAQGHECFRNDWAAFTAVVVYGSCLYLFSAFFVQKYLSSPVDKNQNHVKFQ